MGGEVLYPSCKYHEQCFAKRRNKCMILTSMPKPMPDGKCPFWKENTYDNKKEAMTRLE